MIKIGQQSRATLAFLVLFSFVVGQLSVGGQTRRARPSKPVSPPSKPGNQQTNAPGAPGRPIRLVESPKSSSLGKAFASGALPDPMRLPAGTLEEQAATLAKAVIEGNDSSTAAIYAGILASGYGVRDADGSILQTTEHGQGLALNAWEVAAIAKLYGEGYGVGLGQLSEAFTRNVPAFRDIPLANVLVEGIRAGAKSDNSSVRFWARFIVELGRNSTAPYDLLGTVDAARIRLDALQLVLILSRLTGDLTVLDKRQSDLIHPITAGGGINSRIYPDLHHPAAYRYKGEGALTVNPSSNARYMKLHGPSTRVTQLPCSTSDTQDLILSYDAIASTTLFGILADKKGGNFEAYAGKAGLANIVLTVLKFLASYALLKVEITMDADKLVRTKNTSPGERRLLTAKLQMDTGKWQAVNCLRPFLNLAGLDFDLPKDGPISGVNVEWLLVMGGDDRSVLDRISQSDAMRILSAAAQSFVSGDPAAHIDNTSLERSGYGKAFVSLSNTAGRDMSMAKQSTDNNGISRVYVIGTPQEKDLSHEKLTETYKVAGVRVDVQLKPMKIAGNELSNVGDLAGNVISFLTGDIVGGAIGTAAETLYRSNWYRSEPFYFLVKDWEPCTGQWTGTIEVQEQYSMSRSEDTPKAWGKRAVTESYSATITVGERNLADGRINMLNSDVKTKGSYEETWDDSGKVGCYKANHQITKLAGDLQSNTGVSVIITPDMHYSVNYQLPTFSVKGQYDFNWHVEGDCHNPFITKSGSGSRPLTRLLTALQPDIEGVIDPSNPGVIKGSRTISQEESGGTRRATVTWNLVRCAGP